MLKRRKNQNDDSVGQRCPTRERSMPKKFDEYVANQVNDEDNFNLNFCYRVGSVPKSYGEAIKCDERREWQTAINSEMDSLVKNKTFEVTELPQGKSVIGGK